ncbi:MAG: PDR/VanB family oxidoreductase [Rhodococcus sp. (in: high G+C Gram-positive bacteria)]|nr:PDR/VanB family oxidoreductase [Rhodococcus sp. (in: high G+C Gram-positive bacteria)]
MNPSSEPTWEVVVREARDVAAGIKLFRLERSDGSPLPDFAAGDHIGITVAPGITRSYSLIDSAAVGPRAYRVAVALAPASRGGSKGLHDMAVAGSILRISRPSSGFPVFADAPLSVLIAGGIGITPVLSAARFLSESGRPWVLHYAVATRGRAAFIDELIDLSRNSSGEFHLHVDAETNRTMDVAAIVANTELDAHIYCCGPAPMIAAFDHATTDRDPTTVHVERFANDTPAATGGFVVELARSALEVTVQDDESILDAVLDAGVTVDFSCMEGICGSCRVGVLAGSPDHRDTYLSKDDRASGSTMIICCSGAKGDRIVLDI